MNEADRGRLEQYRQERVEVLASISDIQKGGWRYYKTLGGDRPSIDVTYERIDELEHRLDHLEVLIAELEHRDGFRHAS